MKKSSTRPKFVKDRSRILFYSIVLFFIFSFFIGGLLITKHFNYLKFANKQLKFPEMPQNSILDYDIITFYYPWYGNPDHDKEWKHWNHEILDGHHIQYRPPEQIGADYYPQIGLYSSRDPISTATHMKMLHIAGIGAICVSWWGRGKADSQGGYTDSLMEMILEVAHKYEIKVAFHLEPYEGRTPDTVKQDIVFMQKQYFSHPAIYRPSHTNFRPPIFVYDSYISKASDWKPVLQSLASNTNEQYRPFMIGLIVRALDVQDLYNAGFDGAYSYFATDGFTYGSTWKNWIKLQENLKKKNILFIPSIGPGYADLKIRPWNPKNQRDREQGKYYDRAWNSVMQLNAPIISITSFNEWHEGTQIEPSVSKSGFMDFRPHDPDYYLKRTKYWINQRKNASTTNIDEHHDKS